MKLITMSLQGLLLVTVAVATSAADGDDPSHLRYTGYPGYPEYSVNITDLSRMSRSIVCLRDGKPTESCNTAGGFCIDKNSPCNGARENRACRAKGCTCCMPHVLAGCRPSKTCSASGGHCVNSAADCTGVVDPQGCKPGRCMCCIPSGFDLDWVYLGNDTFVPFPNKMSWYDAQDLCHSHGLNLYHPRDILAVAEYMETKTSFHNISASYWLGAKGNDGINQFYFNGAGLSLDDPWYIPGVFYNNGTNDCVACYYTNWNTGQVLWAQVDSCTARTDIIPLCG